MNWTWPSSLDELWYSPSFPVWLTLAAAGFFGLILLIALLRAERSVANGALTVITFLAIGIAFAVTVRPFEFPGGQGPAAGPSATPPARTASLPALACVDDLAGDAVLNACEKVLFGTADSTAAAVSYAASLLTRLNASGDVATANRNPTVELDALRRSVERDRYGLMAYVLTARDRCTSAACPIFRSLTNSRQVASNMDERVYEGLVVRYSGTWNAPPMAAISSSLPGIVGALTPGVPTGKPTNAEFPSASSTPPISIMNPEPPAAPAKAAPPPARPTAVAAPPAPAAPAAAPAAAKKQPAPKAARAPTPLAPSSPQPPQEPPADND